MLIHTLSFAGFVRPHALTFVGIVPSYFTAIATLLALLTGFVASDTWERQRQGGRAAQSESDNVLAVYDLSVASAPDMSAIRKALQNYVDAVINDEWPQMANGRSSQRAADALGALLREAALPRFTAEAGAPTQAALLGAVLKIRSDRGERLSLNQHRTADSKWLALLILGALTQMAIGIVHLDRRRAQLAALAIFTASLVSTLGLIAVHEYPFDGPDAIKPTAMQQAAARIVLPPPPTL